MIGDLREAQTELEDYYAEDQKEVEQRVEGMTHLERVNYLTQKTEAYTAKMMDRWDKLAKLLIVKHNDQTMRTPPPAGGPGPGAGPGPGFRRPTPPQYAPAFIDAVKQVTGDRYVKPAE